MTAAENPLDSLREALLELHSFVSLIGVNADADTLEFAAHGFEDRWRAYEAALSAVEQLVADMRFYADADNYETRPLPGSEDRYGVPLTACPIEDDCGELARDALAAVRSREQQEPQA